jgi:hypothetical protein
VASAPIPRDEATHSSKDLGAELAMDKRRIATPPSTRQHAPKACDARFTPRLGEAIAASCTRTRPTRRLGAARAGTILGPVATTRSVACGKRKAGVAEERAGRSGGVADVADASPSPDWARGAAARVGARDGAELSLHTCLTPTLATRQRVDAGCLGPWPLRWWKRLVFVQRCRRTRRPPRSGG